MATKTKAAAKPLAQLEAALPQTTNDELLWLALAVLEEGVERARNYAALLDDDEVSSDAVNEGAMFARRLMSVYSGMWSRAPKAAQRAYWRLHNATADLDHAWTLAEAKVNA